MKLGDLCHVITKGTTPTSVGFKFENDGVNFVKVESLTSNNGFIPAKFAKISSECNESLKRSQLQKRDILFSIAGALGRTAIVTEDILPANTNQALAIIRLKPNIEIDTRYLLYTLNSDTTKEQSERNKGGVAQQNLSLTQLKNYDVYLPPLPEQERIVAKLDAAFAEIDTAIEAVAKSVDDVSRLLESKITDYLSNQNCSRTLTLKDVCVATQGVQIAKSNQSGEKLDGYARYLYISDFSHDKNIKYVKNDYPKKTVFPTDIIVVNTGASAGKIFKGIPGILSNNLFKVSPVEALINADFLYLFVNSLIFKKYQAQIMRGTANPHMGHQNFLSTPIQLPEISAQREIVEMVSCLLRHGETIQNAYIKKKISLSSLKSAILSQELQSSEAA